MSIVNVDVNRVSDINQDENIYERLKKVAQDGDIERLYGLIAEDPNILGHFDEVPFCETPLHIAAEKGQTHFAMELVTLKPSLALRLQPDAFGPARQPYPDGDAELLSEFLVACPSSVEDLTIKCETAVHIAVKNHHFEAFKVLLGWVQRVNREDILDWKDEDGNTVFHIAASINQTESLLDFWDDLFSSIVFLWKLMGCYGNAWIQLSHELSLVMKLLRKTVKVKAKNLDGKTAMDILQTHVSTKTSRLLSRVKERLLCGSTITLAGYLSKTPSSIEKRISRLGQTNLSKTRHSSQISSDSRSVILVVAILIVTATYQAGLSPPGGFWQEDSKIGDRNSHFAGEMEMPVEVAFYFYFINGIAFFSSLYVIMILIVGLPMWKVLYGSIAALAIANFATFFTTFPSVYDYIFWFPIIIAYPLTVVSTVSAPFVSFFVNKRRRQRVDHPSKYFSSPNEI
ncbi:hypothetical protein F2Q69_00039913 [Brassica cretica]|uniref:PGG domain-containing protein n=1 Tax=Brassica cretica TaxID=69181 RepID=A0A8S9NE37_BRACR|nr:hypothetical protein F2Q69_00039913 [Brassica cretica]